MIDDSFHFTLTMSKDDRKVTLSFEHDEPFTWNLLIEAMEGLIEQIKEDNETGKLNETH
jgi:hypothetical protein